MHHSLLHADADEVMQYGYLLDGGGGPSKFMPECRIRSSAPSIQFGGRQRRVWRVHLTAACGRIMHRRPIAIYRADQRANRLCDAALVPYVALSSRERYCSKRGLQPTVADLGNCEPGVGTRGNPMVELDGHPQRRSYRRPCAFDRGRPFQTSYRAECSARRNLCWQPRRISTAAIMNIDRRFVTGLDCMFSAPQ